MKRILLIPVITIFCLTNGCKAQEYKYIYYLDKNYTSTKATKAITIAKGLKEDGTFRLDYFDKKEGYLFMSAHYADSSLRVLQGEYTEFNKTGKTENEGAYLNNRKNGLWLKWDTLGRKIDSTVYQDDKAATTASFEYYKNGVIRNYSFTDSLADTMKTVFYQKNGTIYSEVFFKGQSGIRTTYDSTGIKSQSLFSREMSEASFPGGQPSWIRYLQENLDPNTPVRNGAPVGSYQVFVKFIVSKDGSISEVKAETNYGFGMEEELVRIIKNGPNWVSAIQYGHKVNAYRRQPVTFIVEKR